MCRGSATVGLSLAATRTRVGPRLVAMAKLRLLVVRWEREAGAAHSAWSDGAVREDQVTRVRRRSHKLVGSSRGKAAGVRKRWRCYSAGTWNRSAVTAMQCHVSCQWSSKVVIVRADAGVCMWLWLRVDKQWSGMDWNSSWIKEVTRLPPGEEGRRGAAAVRCRRRGSGIVPG